MQPQIKSCPNCKRSTAPNQQSCAACGFEWYPATAPPVQAASISSYKTCGHCGQPAILTMRVCQRCGLPYALATKTEGKQPRPRRNTHLLIMVSCFTLVAAFSVAYFIQRPGELFLVANKEPVESISHHLVTAPKESTSVKVPQSPSQSFNLAPPAPLPQAPANAPIPSSPFVEQPS